MPSQARSDSALPGRSLHEFRPLCVKGTEGRSIRGNGDRSKRLVAELRTLRGDPSCRFWH